VKNWHKKVKLAKQIKKNDSFDAVALGNVNCLIAIISNDNLGKR